MIAKGEDSVLVLSNEEIENMLLINPEKAI